MTDPEQIAAKLTKAQREALSRLGPFRSCRWPCTFSGSFRGIRPATLNSLMERNLVWGKENHTSRHAGLLGLGMEVRAILMRDA